MHAADDDSASFFNRAMSEPELIEYLSFQAYYELRAAQFIGRWLSDTPEHDAFVLLAQQVEDEANHYEYCMRALERRRVTTLDGWKPEPEWEEWIDVWYPSGADTLAIFATPQFAIQSYVFANKLGWKPQIFVDDVDRATYVESLRGAAATAGKRPRPSAFRR